MTVDSYLSQMVVTSQGTTNAIKPRLASLFELVASSISPTLSANTTQHESPALAMTEHLPATANEAAIDSADVLTETSLRPKYSARETRLIIENDPERLAHAESGRHSIAQSNALEHRTNEPASAVSMTRHEIVEPQRVGVNQPIGEIMPIKEIESQREIVPMIESVLMSEPRVPESIVLRPQTVQSQPKTVNDFLPQMPVIRVTIGRIDVRANFVSTPPLRVTPSGPKLSLDNYLKPHL